jgi:hypothetical protein
MCGICGNKDISITLSSSSSSACSRRCNGSSNANLCTSASGSSNVRREGYLWGW